MLRKLLKWPMRTALKSRALRGKIIHELVQDYFTEIGVFVPLSHGISCPIARPGLLPSFAEVFIEGEYAPMLEHMDLPRRWLDLGCHAGFFSAYIGWQWRRRGSEDFSAMLVDADPRVGADVEKLIRTNQLEKQLRFVPGLVGRGAGERAFGLREAMASSADVEIPAESVQSVRILTSARMIELFPGPYELLKVDVEGAEMDLADSYPELLAQTSRIVLEWHSFKPGDRARDRVCESLAKHGFELKAMLQPARVVQHDGTAMEAGCDLYQRSS